MGKKGMSRPHKCSYCGKTFAMEWARTNCQKSCKERQESMKSD